ncbi:MAG: recombinase RecT [Clostridia bacterium]|nr:recombinase RecT [Clostridia bacterium]
MAVPLSKSDCVPDQYKNNPANCMIAIDIASRMGLSPLTVMQNLYIVKGKPSWSGQACRALIENNGRFKDLRPVYVGRQGEDDWGCYYEATDTITGETVRGTKVDILMAKKEGWYSKKDRNGNETSKWQTMPELMLAYRAAAFFARVHCPSAMMGFQTVEEVNDVANAERKHRIDSITSDILGG